MLIPKSIPHPELDRLLKEAAKHELTPREMWLQRVSFAYGQSMDNPRVTREMVEREAERIYGPCPD